MITRGTKGVMVEKRVNEIYCENEPPINSQLCSLRTADVSPRSSPLRDVS